KYQNNHMRGYDYGATSVFVGSMRDFNENTKVSHMFLEHYPEMTESQLEHTVKQAQQSWTILDTLIIHRIGNITPADTIVMVAVWAAHRGDAFDASRFIMEKLKSTVPFWKKESIADSRNNHWVTKNTNGYSQPQSRKLSDTSMKQ
ncbi:MAG TPA: molybdenum cofactor biosynthesis protein MoaE, partial [Crenotrichaceae bacterium]|nr:molybdenum cofactor biosynthesis protein MoaE [Crenotrichaceae bacterium]